MKTIYISGQISNNPNFAKDFERAEKKLTKQGYNVINTVKVGSSLGFLTYEQFMQLDFRLIDIADSVYMLKGWEKSQGATAEYHYAKSLGKEIINIK